MGIKLCRCKCGEKPVEGKQFVKGHVAPYREKVFRIAANSEHPKNKAAHKVIAEFDWKQRFIDEKMQLLAIPAHQMAMCPKCEGLRLVLGPKGQPVCTFCGFDQATAGPYNVPNGNAPYECTKEERRKAAAILDDFGIASGSLSILEVRGILDNGKIDGVPLTEINTFGVAAP